MNDHDLKKQTYKLKIKIQKGESLENILPFAFAVVREASKRTLGIRHYDVQIMGGIVLHEGKIAEMHTGEGKTLASSLPLYLNALTGKGVHLVTVNDYLAKRDADMMGKIFNFLDLSVGIILSNMSLEDRKKAYQSDITYGANNEFGFDYLKDNMILSLEEKVQRKLNFVIIDEIDSILIDEARTPLIISGISVEDNRNLYFKLRNVVPKLKLQKEKDSDYGDFYLDEKEKQAYLTENGHKHLEKILVEKNILNTKDSLYHPHNLSTMHHINNMIRAYYLYQKNIDYIIQNKEIIIVDEHTGRAMPGRRWSDGLHQAIESKEGLYINKENKTLASITFQNYFRLYKKISGMTGTADTESYEFHQTYGLEVIVIPTNRKMIRKDFTDIVYMTKKEKFKAIINEIQKCVKKKQPVLVGTVSIEISEYLSSILKKLKIKHEVLNAKYHEREAEIIEQAGQSGSVTIATNMAGRGTDILLGGNWKNQISKIKDISDKKIQTIKKKWKIENNYVLKSGGLYILGTERHESRRIDNQLRGRAGRQGDPGSSRFFLSLEDNLIRIFGADKIKLFLKRVGLKENESLDSKMITQAIANAQKKVEGFYFDMRKNLLEYDDVANDQRKVIYKQRFELLKSQDTKKIFNSIIKDFFTSFIENFFQKNSIDKYNIKKIENTIKKKFMIDTLLYNWFISLKEIPKFVEIKKYFFLKIKEEISKKERYFSNFPINKFYKNLLLQILDKYWQEHLMNMDFLKQNIHLRGYAQKDPKKEYKYESFELFSNMLENIKYEVIKKFFQIQNLDNNYSYQEYEVKNDIFSEKEKFKNSFFSYTKKEKKDNNNNIIIDNTNKIGRNQNCPCGSKKKYKKCHGKLR
uniref:Protein translocase subunit SecA n=1 Tax=Candidatus Endecteinascidia fromenterensis TaxID=266021 RepID=G8D466_9GAMM|nr:preprotein translocase subunit SecA [Candidatus Endoecteinascidia frumentensis]